MFSMPFLHLVQIVTRTRRVFMKKVPESHFRKFVARIFVCRLYMLSCRTFFIRQHDKLSLVYDWFKTGPNCLLNYNGLLTF